MRAFNCFGLKQKAPEEQYAQNHQDRNDDDLDKAHGKLPKTLAGCKNKRTGIARLFYWPFPKSVNVNLTVATESRMVVTVIPRGRQLPGLSDRPLFEAQVQTSAEKARIADVRAAKNRLEIIEEQLVCQVLDVELKVQRSALFLKQICAH